MIVRAGIGAAVVATAVSVGIPAYHRYQHQQEASQAAHTVELQYQKAMQTASEQLASAEGKAMADYTAAMDSAKKAEVTGIAQIKAQFPDATID
jgi:hypothetical protein